MLKQMKKDNPDRHWLTYHNPCPVTTPPAPKPPDHSLSTNRPQTPARPSNAVPTNRPQTPARPASAVATNRPQTPARPASAVPFNRPASVQLGYGSSGDNNPGEIPRCKSATPGPRRSATPCGRLYSPKTHKPQPAVQSVDPNFKPVLQAWVDKADDYGGFIY